MSPNLPPHAVLVERMRQLNIQLKRRNFDLHRACTFKRSGKCWLLQMTSIVNDFLRMVDMELLEDSPKHLTLRSYTSYHIPNSSNEADFRILSACMLVNRLFVYHHCIDSVYLLDSIYVNKYPVLFSDAMSRHLLFRNVKLDVDDDRNTFASVVCFLKRPEVLHVSKLQVNPQITDDFAKVLRSPTLREVVLTQNHLCQSASNILIAHACKNLDLRVLRLEENSLGDLGAESIGKLIKSGQLEELHLIKVTNLTERQVMSIAKHIGENRTLKKLHMSSYALTSFSGEALMAALARNDSIIELSLKFCNIGRSNLRHLATVLRVNTRLEVVNLRHNGLNASTCSVLANALQLNKTLRELNLKDNAIDTNDLIPLIHILRNNKLLHIKLDYQTPNDAVAATLQAASAYTRVQINYGSKDILTMAKSITTSVTSIKLKLFIDEEYYEFDSKCLGKLFQACQCAKNLKEIKIDVFTTLDTWTAISLSKLLKQTKSLKKVVLKIDDPDPAILSIITDALAENSSVIHFEMDYTYRSRQTTNSLMNMLRKNYTLQHLGVISTSANDLDSLVEAMSDNVTLISCDIQETADVAYAVYKFRNTLRRNVSFVNRAVEYAMDPQKFGFDKFPAVLFERLSSTNKFKHLLSQFVGVANVDIMYNRTRRYITNNFFAITGICPHSIKCHPPRAKRRRTQIDSLDYDSISEICSHLRVTDVR
uniref:Putative nlr family card domain protein n=1 Tax=Ixodes ricinus TaxID=34613 RepID=A0A0K8RMV6_IXORI